MTHLKLVPTPKPITDNSPPFPEPTLEQTRLFMLYPYALYAREKFGTDLELSERDLNRMFNERFPNITRGELEDWQRKLAATPRDEFAPAETIRQVAMFPLEFLMFVMDPTSYYEHHFPRPSYVPAPY